MPPNLDGLAAKFCLGQCANHAIDKRLGHFDECMMWRDRDLAQLPRVEPGLVCDRADEISRADTGGTPGADEQQRHRSSWPGRLGIASSIARS